MNRSGKIILFCIILCGFLIYCSRDKSILSDNLKTNNYITDPNYPTTLLPLTRDELQPLQKEFDTLNGSAIRTRLNQYGFTGEHDYSKLHPNPGIKFTQNKALQMAVSCLLKNKKFTNTADSQDLFSNIHHIQLLATDSTAWRIIFGPQNCNGLKIPFSWIYVSVYGDGVYELSGFWYSNIYIPPIDNFTINHAKANIIGKSITWYGFDGKPNEFIIDQNSILEPIEKAIYALDKQDSIELRVVWEIPIDFYNSTGWHLYFDTTTGEIVQIIQEFRT